MRLEKVSYIWFRMQVNFLANSDSSNSDFCFAVKPGVLRFGPPPDGGDVGAQRSTVAMSPTSASVMHRTQQMFGLSSGVAGVVGAGGVAATIPVDSVVVGGPSISFVTTAGSGSANSTTAPPQQQQQGIKAPKKRKENVSLNAPSSFESVSSNRDEVQSPAYSDISDDSTPVAESDPIGEYFGD